MRPGKHDSISITSVGSLGSKGHIRLDGSNEKLGSWGGLASDKRGFEFEFGAGSSSAGLVAQPSRSAVLF